MDNIEKEKDLNKDLLLNLPNVVGVGIGEKKIEGKDTGEPAIMVFVQEKKPLEFLSSEAVVPPEINGVKTDVIEVGELRPMIADGKALSAAGAENRKKYRPIMGGISGIQYRGTACTIASIVYRNGKRYALQNAHCALPHWTGGKIGDPILQPSPYDGGVATDEIGKAADVLELKFDGSANFFDSALVEISEGIESKDLFQFGIGAHSEKIAYVKVGEEVVKSGRTTGVQRAKVIAVGATAQVTYDEGKVARFDNQIFTENEGSYFVDGGDSSSLVLNASGNPIGQVYAGSAKIAIIAPIEPILRYFGITFTKPVEVPKEGFIALARNGAVRPYVELYPWSAKPGNAGDLDYNLNLRAAPTVSAASMGVLKAGTKFEVVEMVTGEAGYTWAKIRVLR